MACINPDGTLTVVAAAVLGYLEAAAPAAPETIAAGTDLPLSRGRASLRETGRAGLVADGAPGYHLTELGIEVLALTRGTAGDA